MGTREAYNCVLLEARARTVYAPRRSVEGPLSTERARKRGRGCGRVSVGNFRVHSDSGVRAPEALGRDGRARRGVAAVPRALVRVRRRGARADKVRARRGGGTVEKRRGHVCVRVLLRASGGSGGRARRCAGLRRRWADAI